MAIGIVDSNKMQIEISIVVPLYNEEVAFPHLVERLDAIIEKAEFQIEVVLVDDGSEDNTALLMSQLSLSNVNYQSIFLSRNFGHQQAVSAGLTVAKGKDAVMIIDGDLQDPPELIFDFYKHLKDGYDIIYAVRQKRKEGFIKKACYYLFYRLQSRISNINIQIDSGDFCMMARKVVDIINTMPEESRYIRGLRSWVGFRQKSLHYDRDERIAGAPKYSFKMLFKLAYNGVFNFSEFPIKFITALGFFSVVLSLLYLSYTLFLKYVNGEVPTGFTGLLFAIIMFGGVQLLSLGIIGEYVLRIFFQVKERPLFIIKNKIERKEIK